MIICGIDPGTRLTGYGIVELKSGNAKYISHGVIKPKTEDLNMRLQEIHLEVRSILKEFNAEEMAVETSFHAINSQTALKLGQVRGVIILAATLSDIPVFEYTPNEIKKAACGYGHADKQQIGDMVNLLLGFTKGNIPAGDAADALAVGICHSSARSLRRLGI